MTRKIEDHVEDRAEVDVGVEDADLEAVGSSPTSSLATHQSATARPICARSFQRAESPSERRLTILMKSSAKPSAAQPSATPKTARLCVSRGERTR